MANQEYGEAERFIREAIEIFEQSNVLTQVGVCATALGQIQLATAKLKDAESSFNRSLDIFEVRGCKPGMARALAGWARCLPQAAEQQTYASFARALALAIETESTPLVADVLLDVCAGLKNDSFQSVRSEVLRAVIACRKVGWPAKQIAERLKMPTILAIEKQTDAPTTNQPRAAPLMGNTLNQVADLVMNHLV